MELVTSGQRQRKRWAAVGTKGGGAGRRQHAAARGGAEQSEHAGARWVAHERVGGGDDDRERAARRRDEWRAWVAHQNVGGHQVAKGGVARRRDDEEDEPAKSLKVIEGGVVQEKRERVQV